MGSKKKTSTECAGKYKRKFGDRADGRRIRSLPAIDTLIPYLIKRRSAAANMFKMSFEIGKAERYIRQKRKDGLQGFGLLHVLMAAYVRTISKYPGINRFIAGQKHFLHNKIEFVMEVRKDMTIEAQDTILKLEFDVSDTAEMVYEKFNAALDTAFDDESDYAGLETTINRIPGLFKKFAFFMIKFLDYFGILPKSIIHASPFHASLFLTSTGSLGVPAVYHHLYDTGTVSVFCSIGAKRNENVLQSDGSVKRKKFVDCVFTTDDRICDGLYFAKALKMVSSCFSNPAQMDIPPTEIVEDIR